MSKVMRFYNPKTNQYEPINAGGVLDEDTKEILTGKDISKKADKSYVDKQIEGVGKVKSVNGKTGDVILTANDIDYNTWRTIKEEIDLKANTWDLLDKADKSELDKKADKSDLQTLDLAGRTSTIVIANYDSHENSKKGADIVINKGENASIKINKAIQTLKGIGGEIRLMEGTYVVNSQIRILADNIIIRGVGKATVLKVGESFFGVNKFVIKVDNDLNGVSIYDLIISGNNVDKKCLGIAVFGATDCNISNVKCINNLKGGIQLNNNSSVTISNTECKNNQGVGIAVLDNSSATISNVKCIDNLQNGIGMWDNSSVAISNVKCINNRNNGIGMWDNSSVTISNTECKNNQKVGIAVLGSSSATISNAAIIENKKDGIYILSSSKNIFIQGVLLKDNFPEPQYANEGQLNLGVNTSTRRTSYIFATGCKIVDTKGNTRGVVVRGNNHALTNSQFVGNFKEKVNDGGNSTSLIGNVGV